MIDKLEDFSWYNGLYNEVVIEDCYGLKTIDWIPDIVFDIGANVGVFSRFARELFPTTQIVAIEPDPENCELFRKFTTDDNTILLEQAIGNKTVWRHGGAVNGIQVYTSAGLGYPTDELEEMRSDKDITGCVQESTVATTLPGELLDKYTATGQKVIMKIDCEGGENAIWTDQNSLDKMKLLDYIVIELHWYANHGGELYNTMVSSTVNALISFKDTHDITITNILFTAKRKGI
jgi:FkbM family methyltransferase